MNIIKYTDNNAINKPQSGEATVYEVCEVTDQREMTKEGILQCFPHIFAKNVGQLEGEYHVKVDASVEPVQHAPRRVPVALRKRLKTELEKMVKQDILAPVTTPTAWVSSMVTTSKPNGAYV